MTQVNGITPIEELGTLGRGEGQTGSFGLTYTHYIKYITSKGLLYIFIFCNNL